MGRMGHVSVDAALVCQHRTPSRDRGSPSHLHRRRGRGFIAAYFADKHGAITAPLKAAADRFNDRYTDAVGDEDKVTGEELDLFRKDVGSFVRLYDFLSQISTTPIPA